MTRATSSTASPRLPKSPDGRLTSPRRARPAGCSGRSKALQGARALVRDCASQFIDAFDEIFRTEGLNILKTPAGTPVANSFAERWIESIRRELVDRTMIWNQHQLEQLIADYIEHYNQHRPHRSLHQRPPLPADPAYHPGPHGLAAA